MFIILWDVKEPAHLSQSRVCSSRCCGLSSVVYHGWEGKMVEEGRKLENCNRLLRLPLSKNKDKDKDN